jgi:hypothetical protein
MDAKKVEVRAPLTEWEAKEEKRVASIKEAINAIMTMGLVTGNDKRDSIELAMNLNQLLEMKAAALPSFAEFTAEATGHLQHAIDNLTDALLIKKKAEQEAIELEALRAEKAKRDAADKEEALRKEGEARARAEIEKKAAAEREAAEKKANAEREAAEKAIRDEAAARESAIRAEAAEKARIAKIEADAKAAVLEALQAKAAAEAKRTSAAPAPATRSSRWCRRCRSTAPCSSPPPSPPPPTSRARAASCSRR